MMRLTNSTSASPRRTLAGGLAVALCALASTAPQTLAAQENAPELSDPEVAHVAVTANAIDVELAQFALDRTENAEVRQFAEMMIRDHTGVNERASALAGRLGVTPRDNDVSRSLRQGAEEARASLMPLRGAAFDGAYMAREVAYHAAVLEALDDLLIPAASNDELRTLLEEVRPAIASHLAVARDLSERLGR